MDIYQNISDVSVYLKALLEGKEAIDSAMNPPSNLSPEDLNDFYRSCRNRALAGDGLKALFMGTLSTEPITTVSELEQRGIKTEEAQELVSQRNYIRAELLSLVD